MLDKRDQPMYLPAILFLEGFQGLGVSESFGKLCTDLRCLFRMTSEDVHAG
jgi:hypothetical protein